MTRTWTPRKVKDLQGRLEAAYPEVRCALDHGSPYELVVATILSAQCTDARVNLTTPALFRRYPKAQDLAHADLGELEALIRPTGFYHTKARNLIGLGQALVARHGGEVPREPEALEALPGVGQKTANVVLANAFGVPALAVDTHIFRVARRLGLSSAATPEKVEGDLKALFPVSSWINLHHQLIWHGRRVCHARKPACGGCTLLDHCPTGLGKGVDPHTGALVNKGTQAPIASDAGLVGPRRVVSLVPSLTELLVQWGLASRLVGRTRYCVEPAWIRATVASVGGTKDPDLQALVDLQPDLVLMERDENTLETARALDAAGIPKLVLDIRSLADVVEAWNTLGALFGTERRAQALAGALKQVPPAPLRQAPRVAILVWREPWILAGGDTYLADLARQAGFEPLGGPGYPRVTVEDLRALAPHRLLLPTDPFPFKAMHVRELQGLLPGVRMHRMEGKALTWCLSRTVEGLTLLRSLP